MISQGFLALDYSSFVGGIKGFEMELDTTRCWA